VNEILEPAMKEAPEGYYSGGLSALLSQRALSDFIGSSARAL
jgi:hypothetical protein